jgi:hypothetical protein
LRRTRGGSMVGPGENKYLLSMVSPCQKPLNIMLS